MAAIQKNRRRDDVSSWILTSVALSLMLHVLLVHGLGQVRLLDVDVFTSAVSRWFNVVDVPETVPPDIEAAARDIPDQAEQVEQPDPKEVPLLGPNREDVQPSMGNVPDAEAPPHEPARVRLPETELPVIHRDGAGGIDQTSTDLGEVAPIRTAALEAAPPSETGRRKVAAGVPNLPGPPAVSLALAETGPPEPAAIRHAGELPSPKANPDPTPVDLGEAPTAGILIPIEDPATISQPIEVPTYTIPAGPGFTEDEEKTPVIPLSDEVSVKMTMYAEPGNPRQYFRLEIAVDKPDKLPVIPKDVMFVYDVSLSMHLSELRQSREAIVGYLRGMGPSDRFNIVVFSEHPRKLFPDFVEVTPERLAAVDGFIDRIPGQIKTDVYTVLRAVVRDIAQQTIRNRPTNIFFVSDGRSTYGIRDVRRIVNDIGGLFQPNFAIFPFDAGRGGDRYLLDLLAYRSRGALASVDDIDKAAGAQGALFRKFDQPVLMQLRPVYTNLEVEETYPALIPNLYADEPIVIYGRCTPGQNVTIQLQGKNPYARRALVYSHVPGAPDPSRDDIAREWARRKIHSLVADMARFGETPERKAEIEELGLKYNVRTLYQR